MNHYFKWSFTLCCLLLGMQFSLFNLQAQSSSEELLFITLVGGTPKFVAQTLGSSQTRELANAIFESGAEITSISLSPNRTSIAFSSRKDRGGGYPTETIFVFNLQTGVLRQITSHDSTSAFPVWSPDSSRLAYLTGFGMNGYDGVNIVNLTTLEITQVLNQNILIPIVYDELGMAIRGIAWSPYGETLAIAGITSLPDSKNLLVKVSLNPFSGEVVSPSNVIVNAELIWSPTESDIIYVGCSENYIDDLCKINIATKSVTFLTNLADLLPESPNPSITNVTVSTNKIVFRYGFGSAVFQYDSTTGSLTPVPLVYDEITIVGLVPASFTINPVVVTATPSPTSTPISTPTNTPSPTPAVTCNTTVASGNNAALITAIQSGNSAGSPYVICLGNGMFTLTASHNTLDGGNGLPQITGNVTLYGTGAVIERQSAAAAFRLLRVNAGGRLKLEGVTVRGGAAGTSSGGGVRNLGTLELVNAIIENNTGANGAGIQNNVNATLTASNSTIRTNTATTNGGGLLSNTGSATTLTNTTFTGNVTSTTGGLGGGLFMTGATLNINGGTFSTNQARNGGAIFVNSSTSATITGTTFTGNTAALNGGGVYVNSGTVAINDATFTSNTAQANGGAIQTTTGTTLNLTNVDVLNNSAVSVGGGLMSDGLFTITGSIFTGNNAGVRGGGISAANGTNRIVQNSCLSANTSPAAREVTNDGTAALTATSNYWGAATGAVSGQVSANVNTGSFLGSCGS